MSNTRKRATPKACESSESLRSHHWARSVPERTMEGRTGRDALVPTPDATHEAVDAEVGSAGTSEGLRRSACDRSVTGAEPERSGTGAEWNRSVTGRTTEGRSTPGWLWHTWKCEARCRKLMVFTSEQLRQSPELIWDLSRCARPGSLQEGSSSTRENVPERRQETKGKMRTRKSSNRLL